MVLILITLAVPGWLAAFLFAYRLYRWERVLTRSRVKVYFKNRTAMTPRLIDWVRWADQLRGDRAINGQVVYKQGGTTIAITKAHAYVPKAKSKTMKEKTSWRQRVAGSRRGSQQPKEGHSKPVPGVRTPR